MKKVCVLLTAVFCLINVALKAQDTTATNSKTKVYAGFLFTPQGGISLKKATKTETFYPFFLQLQIMTGNWIITPFYNTTTNASGLCAEYALSPKMGAYVVGTKNTLVRGGYTGIGIDRPVFNGYGSAFVEFGSDWGSEYNPYLYSGVFIPLVWKVSK